MIKKTYSQKNDSCHVTFKLPADVKAKKVCLAGEFNDWDEKANPLRKLKDGSFSVTLRLKPGETYRFRYVVDGRRWENDWAADGYVPNPFGSDDSVAKL